MEGKQRQLEEERKREQIKRGLNAICPALKAANGRDDHEGMLKRGFFLIGQGFS